MIRIIKYWLSPKGGYTRENVIDAFWVGYLKACSPQMLDDIVKNKSSQDMLANKAINYVLGVRIN